MELLITAHILMIKVREPVQGRLTLLGQSCDQLSYRWRFYEVLGHSFLLRAYGFVCTGMNFHAVQSPILGEQTTFLAWLDKTEFCEIHKSMVHLQDVGAMKLNSFREAHMLVELLPFSRMVAQETPALVQLFNAFPRSSDQ